MGAAGPVEQSLALDERIGRLTRGDAAAKAWLYDRFAPALERRIRGRYGMDVQLDPEELLHDLFVWCFQDDGAILASFVRRTSAEQCTEYRLQGYLWGLVSGLVSNRRRARRRAPGIDSIEDRPLSAVDDPEHTQSERDAALRLIDCIRGQGSRLFLYFTLRFVEGLTPDEIGHVTGWARDATYRLRPMLKSAVQRCVEKLGL